MSFLTVLPHRWDILLWTKSQESSLVQPDLCFLGWLRFGHLRLCWDVSAWALFTVTNLSITSCDSCYFWLLCAWNFNRIFNRISNILTLLSFPSLVFWCLRIWCVQCSSSAMSHQFLMRWNTPGATWSDPCSLKTTLKEKCELWEVDVLVHGCSVVSWINTKWIIQFEVRKILDCWDRVMMPFLEETWNECCRNMKLQKWSLREMCGCCNLASATNTMILKLDYCYKIVCLYLRMSNVSLF